MSQTALYRKWRPQNFATIVGQKAIVTTLRNALREQRLAHAYLFSGPRGTGKTSTARILAKAINCLEIEDGEPCNRCTACIHITQGMELDVIEIDAASHTGVENIRELTEKLNFIPVDVRKKIVIIDEVHMLSVNAFNALLKTLEEPPEHAIFILATTEMHKVLPTIISRCQRFEFKRITIDEQIEHLRHVCAEENIAIDEETLHYLARLSDGGMRDALSLLDQTVSYAGKKLSVADFVDITGGLSLDQYRDFFEAMLNKDVARMLDLASTWLELGKNAAQSLNNLIEFFRDILVAKLIPNSKNTQVFFQEEYWQNMIQSLSKERIYESISILSEFVGEMKYAAHPQTILELALIKLCAESHAQNHPAATVTNHEEIRTLHQKIHQLELLCQTLSKELQSLQSQTKMAIPHSANKLEDAIKVSKVSAQLNERISLQEFYDAQTSQMTKQYQHEWPRVMAAIKEATVSLHAWLKEGKPVAFLEQAVLLVFNSAIHCETTNKLENKTLLEAKMEEVYGHPIKIIAIQQFEWSKVASQPEKQEVLEMNSPSLEDHDKPPWVEEAIQFFGDQIVEIK